MTAVKDLLCDHFQEMVSETLIRHKSILDIMSKFQEVNARANRAVSKAVTSCGCVRINAERQQFPPDLTLQELRERMDGHLSGELCEQCKEIVEAELGATFYYMAALCNALGLNLYDILLKEQKRLSALGVFHFS